jgi:hypothetical protein
VTLRLDAHGRPIGLDWTVCNDGNPRPEIWSDWHLKVKANKKRHPDTLNPGIGRGGNVWMGAKMEAQIVDVYQNTRFGPYDIAEMFGITHKTVYRVLQRNDIPLRSKRREIA